MPCCWGGAAGALGPGRPRNIRTLLLTALVSTLVLSVLLPWLLEDKIIAMTAVGMAMACWIAVLAVAEAVQRVSRGTKTSLSYWGMVAAHLGLAVTITGIAFSQNYSVERDVRMRAGDSVTFTTTASPSGRCGTSPGPTTAAGWPSSG
ncbi:cytochrome c-type biogenesis protein F2 [Salmonella enterica subsp. enterica serovar Daytona]|uniref:Cytochrome c-type biogenesis protein F2 n=1 Tax=Salmonella enterica subsp. enterica serovar Daytona TaxID=1962639 RepID=A0A447JFI8_SALET|nr:cytochrome c-type biogenesis protein F2 [Salmonella enterica subsp. enterica serovar Daytona]